MKIYITHYSKNKERKNQLEKRLSNAQCEWITKWDKEDLFVKWVKWYTNSDQYIGHISLILKHLWCMYDMIQNNIEECIILEDDVVFESDWLNKIKNFPKNNVKFLKLGSIFKHLEYVPNKIYQIGNPGGTEALWVSKEFAKVTLANLDFQQTIDIFYGGILTMLNHPILCIPICSQTSVYESSSTLSTNECKINWIDYLNNFKNYKKYNFKDLLENFKTFENNKKVFETKFENRFNYKLNLEDFNYLRNYY